MCQVSANPHGPNDSSLSIGHRVRILASVGLTPRGGMRFRYSMGNFCIEWSIVQCLVPV